MLRIKLLKQERVSTMPVSQEKSICWLHILFIIGVGLILAIPAIVNGCLASHDFRYHLVYSKHFSAQFWQGDLYPRWLKNMNAGFGSPTFFFYAPIPYFFTSLLSPLFHYNTLSCSELSLSASLALVASGLSAYIWLRKITSDNSAVIASIMYMAWPYHLAVDLYIRFAFAEYWSFVWMPLILYFTVKLIKNSGSNIISVKHNIGSSGNNIIGLAISYTLLALTHLPSFIIFCPVAIVYAFFVANRNQWKRISVCLSLSILIAIGLSAIYWLPAMTTQASISMYAILTGMYDYANNFLFTGPKVGHNKNFWRYLELLTGLTGGLAFCTWKMSKKYLEATFRREINYWAIVALLSLFMMLPLSKFVWDVLPVIQRIQYPWRFNTVLTVATIGLFALAISRLKIDYSSLNNLRKKNLLFMMIHMAEIVFILTVIKIVPLQGIIGFWGSRNTLLSLSLITMLLLKISFMEKPINFSSHKYLSIGILLTITIFSGVTCYDLPYIFFAKVNDNSAAKALEVSKGADEHRPQWVPKKVFNEKYLARLSEISPLIRINAGRASCLIRQWQSRKIVFQVNATTDTEFTIHQFYYPGWTAKIEGSSQSLPVYFSELGLLQVSVPSGNHKVFITLDAVIEERIGQIISAITAILTLVFALQGLLSKDKDCGSIAMMG